MICQVFFLFIKKRVNQKLMSVPGCILNEPPDSLLSLKTSKTSPSFFSSFPRSISILQQRGFPSVGVFFFITQKSNIDVASKRTEKYYTVEIGTTKNILPSPRKS